MSLRKSPQLTPELLAVADRKVRILLRLRKELMDLPIGPASQDDSKGTEDIERAPESDSMFDNLQGVRASVNLK